jgi:hypothetical protein
VSDAEEGIEPHDGREDGSCTAGFQGDSEAQSALYTCASPRSRYLRFFSPGI